MVKDKKTDHVCTTVWANQDISKKASYISRALGITKSQLFADAMAFYIEHHQELLPSILQTPKATTESE